MFELAVLRAARVSGTGHTSPRDFQVTEVSPGGSRLGLRPFLPAPLLPGHTESLRGFQSPSCPCS